MSDLDMYNAYKDAVLEKVCGYIEIEVPTFNGFLVEDCIKEACIAKLCRAIGIKCAYNYKNIFFDFFSSIMGEVIVHKLEINIKIDKFNLRFLKIEDINLIHTARVMLETTNINDAFIKVYELAERFRYVIPNLATA